MKKLNISLQALAPAFDWIEARTKLQRILMYIAAVVVLVGAFVYFAYLPKHKEKAALGAQFKELSAKLDKAKKNAKQLNAYRTNHPTVRGQEIGDHGILLEIYLMRLYPSLQGLHHGTAR